MINFKISNSLSDDEKMIRKTVFIDEQGFNVEFDDTDVYSRHLVMYIDDNPVGCCRFFKNDDETKYHIGRIAVLKQYRGHGYGEKIVTEAENTVKQLGADCITLSAQVRASGFYQKCGYKKCGKIYFDECCEHIDMIKHLR